MERTKKSNEVGDGMFTRAELVEVLDDKKKRLKKLNRLSFSKPSVKEYAKQASLLDKQIYLLEKEIERMK